MAEILKVSRVNLYLAHKQHLLPASRHTDLLQVTRDILALHATDPTGPYLSLWARIPDFKREALEEALYQERALAKQLCMRVTLHVLPSDELPYFYRAFSQAFFERRTSPEFRAASLLVRAGLCDQEDAEALLEDLQHRIVTLLAKSEPLTVQQMGQAVPELKAKIRHSVGKRYEGEFSIGSRLVLAMCAQGLLIRTRPRGTWRSTLYEYAALADWLPDVDLDSVSPQEARAWLAGRYLSAFGPATRDDLQWWLGFSKRETREALEPLELSLVDVGIQGFGGGYLMQAEDAQRLQDFGPPNVAYVFLLPGLDPYLMGYRDRDRFLAPEHRTKIFDRAGNAVPTVWANGRIVGAWGQRKDGGVIYGLFEPVNGTARSLVNARRRELEGFLQGEPLGLRTDTPFTRDLRRGTDSV